MMEDEGTGADVGAVTGLLLRWRKGEREALEELLPLVYDELRRLAGRFMKGEAPSHTLQATALVHEAFLRLVGMEVSWHDRVHFLSVAARAMRRILVDYARARQSAKRGGDMDRLPLEEALAVGPEPHPLILDLDESLQRLAALDERKGRVVELHFFGGLTHEESAAALDLSTATVQRELRQACAWLNREMSRSAR